MSVKIPGYIAGWCLLAAVAQSSAQAQESSHLSILGSVISSACSLTISTPTVDFTGLTAGALQLHADNGVYTAREKSVPFNVTCNGLTYVALSAKADTPATTGLTAYPTYDSGKEASTNKVNEQISLAVDAQAKDTVVGTIMLKGSDVVEDGSRQQYIMYKEDQTYWELAPQKIMRQNSGGYYSWGRNGSTYAGNVVNGVFIVNVNLAQSAVDTMTDALTFNGGTTITLHYV
ncbi:hypothetical protein [[Erwinia] mediterraneensis]|uniref:hypothetical protein n=1 Tax=[Erwinia] mediterraneensis TaxID=2161819 RepID=UPI0010314D57|nr:hypothetical protein [[Erwinia] mediterraneensis]